MQLDYGVTWQKLKDVFKVVGPVANADILMDRNEKSKGCGEVQFDSPTHAINAIGRWMGGLVNESWQVGACHCLMTLVGA